VLMNLVAGSVIDGKTYSVNSVYTVLIHTLIAFLRGAQDFKSFDYTSRLERGVHSMLSSVCIRPICS